MIPVIPRSILDRISLPGYHHFLVYFSIPFPSTRIYHQSHSGFFPHSFHELPWLDTTDHVWYKAIWNLSCSPCLLFSLAYLALTLFVYPWTYSLKFLIGLSPNSYFSKRVTLARILYFNLPCFALWGTIVYSQNKNQST